MTIRTQEGKIPLTQETDVVRKQMLQETRSRDAIRVTTSTQNQEENNPTSTINTDMGRKQMPQETRSIDTISINSITPK